MPCVGAAKVHQCVSALRNAWPEAACCRCGGLCAFTFFASTSSSSIIALKLLLYTRARCALRTLQDGDRLYI